ncbi:hypothetical protein BH09PSE6_BH09PSE6_03030 [soil metagenome]
MSILHSTQGVAAHTVFEVLAYFVGARVYWLRAARSPRPSQAADRWLLVASVVFGAALGSKTLHVLEHLPWLLEQGTRDDWLSGKSVLGGFIGGTLAVELCKHAIGWRQSTGDAWVLPLAIGLCIGRIGCQLSGTWDQTYGIPTSLPWGWDYGDGVARHPTGLYEIVSVIVLTVPLMARFRRHAGARFAAFMTGYCAIRLAIDFLKPPFGGGDGGAAAGSLPVASVGGLSAIQWAACAGLVGYGLLLRHRLGDARALPA